MTDIDNSTPASADGYRAILPKIDGVPEGTQIDTTHPRYREAAQQAHKAGLTQRQFSAFLSFEAQRAVAQRSKTAPAPTVAPAALQATQRGKIEGYGKMSFAQKLAAAGHV